MATYEVDTDLIIHCKVRVTVDADSKDAAIEAVSNLMPANYDRESSRKWRASMDLKAPKGVRVEVLRAYHFEQASGADKARKIGASSDG